MTELLAVGTGDAFGSAGRRQSAYLIRTAGGSVLLDCGATTNGGLAACGVSRDEISAIAVSHFHGDHFGGIPLLLGAAKYQDRRRAPLTIAGPRDVETRVRACAAALGHPLDDAALGFALHFVELGAGREAELGPLHITAFETHHAPDSHPHGLAVRSGSHRIVYSGDTGWFDALPAHAAGADLFLCECTFPDTRTPDHLGLERLAEQRAAFECGQIWLTHLGAEMRARTRVEGFDLADDGLEIRL